MRRDLSCLLPNTLLVLVLFSAPAVAADSTIAQSANACSKYQSYLMQVDGTSFVNPGECTSYVAHGGSLRIGHSEPSIAFNSGSASVIFKPLGEQGQYIVTGLVPGSTARLTLSAPMVGAGCELTADESGGIVNLCSGGAAPPSVSLIQGDTVSLSILDLTTGVLVVEVSAKYLG